MAFHSLVAWSRSLGALAVVLVACGGGVRRDPLARVADGSVQRDDLAPGPFDAPVPIDSRTDKDSHPDLAADTKWEADAPPAVDGAQVADGAIACPQACEGDCNFCGPGGTCVSMTATARDPDGCGSRYPCDEQTICRKLVGQKCSGAADCLTGTCAAGGTCACTLCFLAEIADLGTVPLGSSHSYAFSIRNRGGAVEAPFEVVLSPVGDPIFWLNDVAPCGPEGLAPGGECLSSFRFRPRSLMSSATTIQVRRGGVILARASVGGSGVSGESPWIRDNGLYFGEIPVGRSQRPFPFAIVNPPSGVPIKPTVFVIEGRDHFEFEIVDNSCARLVAPGTECQLFVQFRPSSRGFLAGSLVVRGDSFRAAIGVHGVGL